MDERRDKTIIGLRSIIEGNTYHFEEPKKVAATALLANIISHGDNISRLNYQEETAILDSIIKDWENEQELKAAVQQLNINNWVIELKTANQNFNTKYLERVSETAANDASNIPILRGQATDAYRELLKHIQAHATLSASKVYVTLLNQIDVLAEQYNQLVTNRSNGNNNSPIDDTNS